MKKKVFVTMLTLAVMLSSSVVCYAAGTGFSRKFVDSNQWTHIEYDLKEGSSLMGKVVLPYCMMQAGVLHQIIST